MVNEKKREANRKYYLKNKDKISAYCKEYYKKNRKRILERMRNYRKNNREALKEYDRKRYPKRAVERREYERKKRFYLKYVVLSHYSSSSVPFCECCEEARVEFLTIDHIKGGGNKHRAKIGLSKGSRGFYKWLIDNDFPEGYRVLCFNCNTANACYGYCPHKSKSKFQEGNNYPMLEGTEVPLLIA